MSVSRVITDHKQMDKIETAAGKNDKRAVDKPHSEDAFPSDMLMHNFGDESHKHHPEEDGKAHHIHFERFLKRKWKLFFCLTFKIVLLITYLCQLTIFYTHYL